MNKKAKNKNNLTLINAFVNHILLHGTPIFDRPFPYIQDI